MGKLLRFTIMSIALVLAAASSGCAVNKAVATVDPSTDFSKLNSFHVKKYEKDTRDTNLVIEAKLKDMGFNVSETGHNADAIVTYIDKWFWDITFYLLELTVTIRDPDNDFPLASGNSLHTSLTRKSQEGMVDEVLTNIFVKGQNEASIK